MEHPALVRRTFTFAVFTLLLATAACTYRPGPDPKPGGSGSPGVPAPVRGGTLTYAVADDSGILDPQLSSQPSGFALIRATQRGLMAFPSGPAPEAAVVDQTTPVPDLAEGPPAISPDGRTYTFRIRSGARFGPPLSRAVEAADVSAGIHRVFSVASPLRSYFRIIFGAQAFEARTAPTIAGISMPDRQTIRFALTAPANDFLWMLAHTAASAVPAGTPRTLNPAKLPGSGPYRVSGVASGKQIVLVRNPDWSAAADPVRKAYVDEIRVRVGATEAADVTGEELPAPAGSQVVRGDSGCLLYLFISSSEARLASGPSRIAIALALDKPAILAAVAAADASVAGFPSAALLPPGSPGSTTRRVSPPNLVEARRLLSQAGFASARPIVFGWERSGPDGPADSAGAAAIATQLRAITLATAPASSTAFLGSIYDRYAAKNVPLGLARWCPDWPGRSGRSMIGSLLGSGGVANYGGASDATLDRLILAATVPQEPLKIAGAWKAAEDRAMSLRAVIPIALLSESVPVSPRVAGFMVHPFFLRGDLTALWLDADAKAGPRVQ